MSSAGIDFLPTITPSRQKQTGFLLKNRGKAAKFVSWHWHAMFTNQKNPAKGCLEQIMLPTHLA
jgi:hypothetical protein